MGVVVTFNYPQWVMLFPQFSYLGQSVAQEYFNLATQFHRNDGGGPVTDAGTQSNLLNLATAHLVQLFAPKPDGSGQANRDGNVVGRITNASEGSVSVATEMPMPPNANAAWWNQTQFGAAYWAAAAPFRTMRYRVVPPFNPNPWPIWGGAWWGTPWGR